MFLSICSLTSKTHTAALSTKTNCRAAEWQQGTVAEATKLTISWGGVGRGYQQVKWRWESLQPHWRCLFPLPSTAETNTGLNLQLNPWPAFDLLSGTGGEGQGGGTAGWSGCEMWASCLEDPPRIWKSPIKQAYKSNSVPQFKHWPFLLFSSS